MLYKTVSFVHFSIRFMSIRTNNYIWQVFDKRLPISILFFNSHLICLFIFCSYIDKSPVVELINALKYWMRIASSICSSCILSSTHMQLVLSLFNFNWIGASFWFYWIYLQFVEPRINVMLMENYIDVACSLFILAQWQLALPLYNFKWVDASFIFSYWSHLQILEPRINLTFIENCIDATCN